MTSSLHVPVLWLDSISVRVRSPRDEPDDRSTDSLTQVLKSKRERKKNHFKASTSPLCLSHPLSPSSLWMLFHAPWLLHFSLYDYIYHSRPFITCLHAVFYSSRQNMITTIKNMSCSLKLLQIDEPVNRINYILKKTTTFKYEHFRRERVSCVIIPFLSQHPQSIQMKCSHFYSFWDSRLIDPIRQWTVTE